jgi:hypothetical protein
MKALNEIRRMFLPWFGRDALFHLGESQGAIPRSITKTTFP